MYKNWKILFFVLVILAFGVFVSASQTISFWKFADTFGDPVIKGYVDKWNKTHTVQVKFVSIPWGDYTTTKLSTAFASGGGPDVFWISPGDVLRYANSGAILPFDSYLTWQQVTDMFPIARDKIKIGDHIYGIPIELEPLAIYYNKDLFEKYNLKIPKTWDALVKVAKVLTTKKRWGLVIEPSPSYYELFAWYPWLWSAGGEVVNSDWTKAEIDSPAGIAALKFWSDLVNKYKVSPKSQPSGSSDISMFGSGFCAMQECGMWAINALRQQYPKLKFGIFPIPAMDSNHRAVSVTGGWIQVVNRNSKNVKAAVDFTKWLFYNTDFLKVWCSEKNSKFPSLKSVFEKAKKFYNTPPISFFTNDVFPNARPEPRYPPLMDKALQDAIQSVIFGNISPEIAARTAAMKINGFLATYQGAH